MKRIGGFLIGLLFATSLLPVFGQSGQIERSLTTLSGPINVVGGGILAPGATCSSPTYSFTGSTNNGLTFTGAALTLCTSGTAQVTISNTGIMKLNDGTFTLTNGGSSKASIGPATATNGLLPLTDGGGTSGIALNLSVDGVVSVKNRTGSSDAALIAATVSTVPTTVGALPTCNAGAKGARSFVTDANAATFLTAAAAGGANNVPVVCDGTSWKIG